GTAPLDGAVGEFGDLQNGIDLKRDALQLAILFQRADEVAQVSIGHTMSVAPGPGGAAYAAGVLVRIGKNHRRHRPPALPSRTGGALRGRQVEPRLPVSFEVS